MALEFPEEREMDTVAVLNDMEPRDCPSCEDTGEVILWWRDADDPVTGPCPECTPGEDW